MVEGVQSSTEQTIAKVLLKLRSLEITLDPEGLGSSFASQGILGQSFQMLVND